MDAARAGRAHRPQARDQALSPSPRHAVPTSGGRAHAARRRLTDAGVAAAFAAWRRMGPIRRRYGGMSGLPLPRVAAFILEPQGEAFAALARRAGLKRRPARLPRRARRDQGHAARLATGSNCRSCKRSSTSARSATIRRSPRFGRCCGGSPPRRRGRKPRVSRARRLPPLRAVGCRKILEFSPVNDDSRARPPKLTVEFAKLPTAHRCRSSARLRESGEDRGPRVELPPELIAQLEDAA